MNEIENLLARARRYIKSGNLLLADGDYESAVSRAYYAMFYSTEALLLTKGLSYSSHKGVISAFGRHFVKTGLFQRSFAKSLTRAFQKRQVGEYEFTFVVAENEAREILEEAEKFIEVVVEYLKSSGYNVQ